MAEDFDLINVLIAPSGGLELVSVTVKGVQLKYLGPDLLCLSDVC